MADIKRELSTPPDLFNLSEHQRGIIQLSDMFSLTYPESLSEREQGLVSSYGNRFQRQIKNGRMTYEVDEQHVGILSPSGVIEDYYSSRDNGSLVTLVGSAKEISFKELTTDELQTCGGIGIKIGTPETGQWKIVAHAYANPVCINALLAIGIQRALEQGASLQQALSVQFDTAGSSEKHLQMITEFMKAIGVNADIEFIGSNAKWSLGGSDSRELII